MRCLWTVSDLFCGPGHPVVFRASSARGGPLQDMVRSGVATVVEVADLR